MYLFLIQDTRKETALVVLPDSQKVGEKLVTSPASYLRAGEHCTPTHSCIFCEEHMAISAVLQFSSSETVEQA